MIRISLIAAVIVAVVAFAAAPLSAQEPRMPVDPQISLSNGVAMVALARSAMAEYLLHRTPADKQPIPPALARLASSDYGAAVSLRKDGSLVARSIRQDGKLGRNLITAALEAMRSHKLPDHVTQDVLDECTLDLEILSPPEQIASDADPAKLDLSRIVPGRTGLRLSCGLDDVYLLPSAEVYMAFTPQECRRHCLDRLPPRAEAKGLPLRWAVFAAAHFVGFPDGKTIWLYRGKALLPADSIDANMLSDASEKVGMFLLRSQQRNGHIEVPENISSLTEQIHAAYALAQLSAATGKKEYLAGANAALAYAMHFVKDDGVKAYVSPEGESDQLQPTAMLVLAIRQMPPMPQAQQLVGKLLAAIDDAAGEDGKLSMRLDGTAGDAATPRDWALAILAASSSPAATSPSDDKSPTQPREATEPALAAKLRKSFASVKLAPPDVLDVSWMIRAGLLEYAKAQGVSTVVPLPVPNDCATDEVGGFAPSGQPPTTTVTALAAVNLLVGHTWPGLKIPADKALVIADKAKLDWIQGARRFCHQMMYRPREAYFAREELWIGGVRPSPESGKISLEACAAAIEAFLAK